MQEDNVIVVDNITKSFKVYLDKGKTIKERLVTAGRGKYQTREVLKGISFQVKKGEAIGLIGKNGCGKSTTLKMLTKIIYPDSGSIQIKGKVSSLLELGAGFHPDMSGRENIYLNASIFGLTKREIDAKVDEIIAFSELEEFIENPVRTYSSGMYMRLAFSVAINVDAEVLLIDEILGVGDVSFQKKCFEKLQEIKKSGTTIVIVSHSLEQLERICNRCIWICDGKIREEGVPVVVNARYYKEMEEQRLARCKKEETVLDQPEKDRINEDNKEKIEENVALERNNLKEKEENKKLHLEQSFTRTGTLQGEFCDIKLRNLKNNDSMLFSVNDSMEIVMKLKGKKILKDTNISVSITREDGVYCYGTNTKFDNYASISLTAKEKTVRFYFDDIRLLPGKYYVNFGLYDNEFAEYDVIWNAKKFYVRDENPNGEIGVFRMEHHWEFIDEI